MGCENCDGKNKDDSFEMICPRCEKSLFKKVNSGWFYCLNDSCNVNAMRFNLICPTYKIRCLHCYEITKKSN